MAKTFTNENFRNEVIDNQQPVLVDFWAPWCGPCRALGATIEQLADEQTAVSVGKVNIDENPELAQQFGIRSIPAVLVFNNGEVVDQLVGVQTKQAYQQSIEKATASGSCHS